MSLDLDTLRGLASRQAPAGDAAWFQLDSDDDVVGFVAWLGQKPAPEGAQIAVDGAHVGYVAREAVYSSLAGTRLGFGDSLGWTLPGTPTTWRPYELRCPVDGCPPHYVVHFDPARPPRCPGHDESLSLAP